MLQERSRNDHHSLPQPVFQVERRGSSANHIGRAGREAHWHCSPSQSSISWLRTPQRAIPEAWLAGAPEWCLYSTNPRCVARSNEIAHPRVAGAKTDSRDLDDPEENAPPTSLRETEHRSWGYSSVFSWPSPGDDGDGPQIVRNSTLVAFIHLLSVARNGRQCSRGTTNVI